MQEIIRIHPADQVAVALRPLRAGSRLCTEAGGVTIREDIPPGHKAALCPIRRGEAVIKYGMPIGVASADIPAGAWVHTHNLKSALKREENYTYRPRTGERPPATAGEERFFAGYQREDGRAGVRNELWILPTVGCVNGVAAEIARRSQKYRAGSIDAVVAFSHPYGCSQLGEDQENTRRILAALAEHPNAGGVLVLGLGCENSGVEIMKRYIGRRDARRIKFMVCQEEDDEIEKGVRLVGALAGYAGRFQREPISSSRLVAGLKCGGSDGFSGITANPVTGLFSDALTAAGGTVLLTEVPEMFGAEERLMERCIDAETFARTVRMIQSFKDYYTAHGQPVCENPSPGNREGGITTLEEKSLGCIQKSGTSPVRGVLAYGERAGCKGLNLVSAPGNDLVASTALAAAGAQLVLFTTGRGTPFGCPVPTVKISSNARLTRKKVGWIDFDCGCAAEGTPLTELGEALFEQILRVASGERVKAELSGFRELAIFKQGVTL